VPISWSVTQGAQPCRHQRRVPAHARRVRARFDAAQTIHRLFLTIHLGVRDFDAGEPEFAQNACYARRVEMAREP